MPFRLNTYFPLNTPMAEFLWRYPGCWQYSPGTRQWPVVLRSMVSISICFHANVSMCPRIFWQGISTNNKSPSLQQETSECWCAEITAYQRQLPSVHHASKVTVARMHNDTHGAPLKPGLRASLKKPGIQSTQWTNEAMCPMCVHVLQHVLVSLGIPALTDGFSF